VQIESAAALQNVEAIAAVPGVDVLFVGPRDLSHALGVPGRIDAPEYRAALERVVAAARAAGVAAGVLASGREAAEGYLEDGFGYVAVGSDSSFIAAAARGAARPQQPTT
jgi:2-dehydro-3-deoxyglucarate aldolase/4-hydroxy-2-oxoheptanedioate aldolase